MRFIRDVTLAQSVRSDRPVFAAPVAHGSHSQYEEAAISHLTADQLESELKISERAAADGRRNMPSSHDTQPLGTEGLIIARVESAIQQHANEMLGVGKGTDFTTLPQDLATMADEPQTALAQFRAKKARAQAAVGLELNHAQQDFARAYRDYRGFRIQHGLTETEPRYDDVFWRKVFFLALLFTIEVAANGWVIGQASPGGLVQGWTTALMISILVVLTGTLIGMGPWRYLNYRGPEGRGRVHQIWAVPAVVVGVGMITLFAFYIAHYRYALAHTTLDAPVPDNILTSIATAPFTPFQQLESLVLFVIAMLIGIFAIARGAYWDEPYPGYGHRHRRMEEARERTREIAQGLGRDVDLAKDAADVALHDIAQRSQEAVGALRQAIARTQDNAAEWDYSVAEIIAAGREAISAYRDANQDARDTPVPSYFHTDPFAGEAPPTSSAVLEGLQNAFSRATGNITQCKSQVAGARAQLEAEYHSFYDDELTPFLKGIEDRAVANARIEFSDNPSPAPLRLEETPHVDVAPQEWSDPDLEPPRRKNDVFAFARGGRR